MVLVYLLRESQASFSHEAQESSCWSGFFLALFLSLPKSMRRSSLFLVSLVFDATFDLTDFLAVVVVDLAAAAGFVSSDQFSSFQPQSSLGFLKLS